MANLVHPSVRGKLSGLQWALRSSLAFEGVGWLLVSLVATVVVSFGLDFLLDLPRELRGVILGVCAAGVIYLLIRHLLLPMMVTMDVDNLALLVERKYGQLGDRLISAIQFSRLPVLGDELMSKAMIERMACEANDLAGRYNFKEIVDRSRMFLMLSIAGGSLALVGGFTAFQPHLMGLWAQRNLMFKNVPWPQDTYLSVSGEPYQVLRGDDLNVLVLAHGVGPEYVVVHANYPSVGKTEEQVSRSTDGSGAKFRELVEQWKTQGLRGDVELARKLGLTDAQIAQIQDRKMSPELQSALLAKATVIPQYVKTFNAVNEEFDFYVTGGDDRTDIHTRHHVRVIDPPNVVNAIFTVNFHEYVDLPPEIFDGNRGGLIVRVGSKVNVEAETNKDIKAAQLLLDGSKVGDVRIEKDDKGRPRRLLGSFGIDGAPKGTKDAAVRTLKIKLTDVEGFGNRIGGQYIVQVQDDLPPVADLKTTGVGLRVTAKATVPLLVGCKDDCGISVVTVSPFVASLKTTQPAPQQAAKFTVRKRDAKVPYEMKIEQFGLKVDDNISFQAEVFDNMPPSFGGPNSSKSGVVNLTICTPEDLLDELIARQQAITMDWASVIKTQNTARNKTTASLAVLTDKVTAEVKGNLNASSSLEVNVSTEAATVAAALELVLEEAVNNEIILEPERARIREILADIRGSLQEKVNLQTAALNQAAAVKDVSELRETLKKIEIAQKEIEDEMEKIKGKMIQGTTRQQLANEMKRMLDMAVQIRDEIYPLTDKE